MKKVLHANKGSDILVTMKVIKTNSKGFQRVKDVKIPEVYGRRFKTGNEDLDMVFSTEGFLPGMSFTLAAGPGTGKTTFLLQTLELLEKSGKRTAYVSGEEATAQLAFTCNRLGVELVSVANMSVIEDIFDIVAKEKFDIVVLDSLPALISRNKKLKGRRLEEYLSNYITSKAKELEIVVGVILHFCKDGKSYKGSTLLPHSVDANILMTKSKFDTSLREIETTKNRFSSLAFVTFRMTESGFIFEHIQTDADEDQPRKKKGKSAEYKEKVLNTVKERKDINLQFATQLLGCSLKAQSTLRDLCLLGQLQKDGRGQSARWILTT
jgi:predicted ATP-dependent serine protease